MVKSYGASKLLVLVIERHEADASFIEVEFDIASSATTMLG